jgi:hypothetical protein
MDTPQIRVYPCLRFGLDSVFIVDHSKAIRYSGSYAYQANHDPPRGRRGSCIKLEIPEWNIKLGRAQDRRISHIVGDD